MGVGVLNNPTVATLATQYAVHQDRCRRVNHLLETRYYDPEEKCTCGLDEVLSKLGLPDEGERHVFTAC